MSATRATDLRPGSPESREHWRRVHIAADRNRPLPEALGALLGRSGR